MEDFITRKSLISVIKYNLESEHVFNAKTPKYRVKELKIINEDSLECVFYPNSVESIEIKKEISGIMGSFNGFFRSGDFKEIEFKYYCVSAIDEDDNELLYAISSKETAELIGSNSIEWLKLTYFQENTSDYRAAQAKTLISEAENTLRETICKVLETKYKNNWWQECVAKKIKKDTENLYHRQFGKITDDGSILINYTFTLDLKNVIVSNWNDFKHLFKDQRSFENSMENLNNTRRDEAHNRPISHRQLELLKQVHTDILKGIFEFYPTTRSNYLVENWKLKIQKIVGYGFQHYTRAEADEEFTVAKIVHNSTNLINQIENIIAELDSLTAPIQKKEKHTELITLFNNSINIERKRINSATIGFPKSAEVIEMSNQHHINMNKFIKSFLLEE